MKHEDFELTFDQIYSIETIFVCLTFSLIFIHS